MASNLGRKRLTATLKDHRSDQFPSTLSQIPMEHQPQRTPGFCSDVVFALAFAFLTTFILLFSITSLVVGTKEVGPKDIH